MRPVIGITSDFNPGESAEFGQRGEATYFLRARYVRAVQDLGGIPFMLPSTEDPSLWAEWLGRIDGILNTGSGTEKDPGL
jgi:putative glutamine amidotransferase